MTNSRAKGRRVQTEGLRLLEHHGWQVIETGGAGLDAEDACAIDGHSDRWSVEVKGDQTASLHSLWRQTARQAEARGWAPLLLWRVDRGGWWMVLEHVPMPQTPRGLWRAAFMDSRFSTVTLPASVSLPTAARWLARVDMTPLPIMHLPGGLVGLPMLDALEVW